MKKILFNLTFYPLFVFVTVGMFLTAALPVIVLRPFIGRRKTLWVVRTLICWYGLVIVRGLTFPFVKLIYKDYEKDRDHGACVYVCNHRASSDGFLMALLNREVVQVVNNWPFKIPLIGWVARIAGYLSIRSMPFEEFEKKGCELLKQGVSLIAFPEGSRSMDKSMQQFNGAVFRVAQAARVPVIPVCLSGNQMIPSKGSAVLTPGTIRVHKLPALTWELYRDFSAFKLKNRVREIIQAEVDQLESA